MDTTQLKRIADALEEILRLVKADQDYYKQQKYTAKEAREMLQNADEK